MLAKLLRPGLSVVALDKKGLDDEKTGFRKPCGGLLAPDAQKALSRLNLTLPKSVLVDPQIFAVKTIDLQTGLLRYYQRFYINLDRHQFDLWLESLIPQAVRVERNALCTRISRVEGGYELLYRQNGAERRLLAKVVVGADGACSLVRKSLFPARRIRQYLAIQQHFCEEHPTPFYSCVFDGRITDSYSWSISKDGNFILGGAFPMDGARQRFEELKKGLASRGFLFGEPLKTEACLVSVPRGLGGLCLGSADAFLLGEAAGFVSPSSLEGISYALSSAIALADSLNKGAAKGIKKASRLYARKCLPIQIKLLLKGLKALGTRSRFLRGLAMRSGLKSIRLLEPEDERA
jgi:flavin-dependent dehydrogenase